MKERNYWTKGIKGAAVGVILGLSSAVFPFREISASNRVIAEDQIEQNNSEEIRVRYRNLSNGGFERAITKIVRENNKVVRTLVPYGWDLQGPSSYNWRDGSGNGSPSSVKLELVTKENQSGECTLEGGIVESNRFGLVSFNPEKPSQLSLDIKGTEFDTSMLESWGVEAITTFYDSRLNPVASFAVNTAGGINSYRTVLSGPIGMGENFSTNVPQNARYAGFRIRPYGFLLNENCTSNDTVAQFYIDNVQLVDANIIAIPTNSIQ